ncbi:MAG: InlB B-repeat-containing protein [Peptococcaceae bacterium]|nr:InlB B-repeat-containing protein [Peptococcaceae bacterium]
MKPKLCWFVFLFPFTFVLLLSAQCFVADVYAADGKTVTVKFISYNGTQQDVSTETLTITDGESVQVQVPPLSDYPGWEVGEWVGLPDATSGDFNPKQVETIWVSGDITFWGIYERQVSLTFEVDGDAAPDNVFCRQFVNSADITRIVGGQTFRLPSRISKEGTNFSGWALNSTNGTIYHPGWAIIDLQGSGSAIMYEKWNPIQYTITYNYEVNGGAKEDDNIAIEDMPANSGDLVEMSPRGKKEGAGWEFVGWNTDPDAHQGMEPFEVTKDEVLFAIYRKDVEVTFIDYSGIELTSPPQKEIAEFYNNDPTGTITLPQVNTYTGWTSLGWSTSPLSDATPIDAGSVVTLPVDMEPRPYYGLYERAITVTYDADGGDQTPVPDSGKQRINSYDVTASRDSEIVLPVVISKAGSAGYVFTGWVDIHTGVKYGAGETICPSGNMTFAAAWFSKFYEADWLCDTLGYWNSGNGGYANNPLITYTDENLSKRYLASKRFTREDLPVGSVIEVDAGYGYRPDGWVKNGAAAPGRPPGTSESRVEVTEDWWEDFEYRAFNVYKLPINTVDLIGLETETASHFRIYVPAYKSLDWRETNGGYWDSVNGGYQADPPHPVMDQASSSKFIASKRYTREDLPVGTIIEVDPGYQYRPDGWVYQGKAAPGRFPNLISEQRIILDEERWDDWWGDYEYRGFNVTTDPHPTVSLDDMEAVVPHFRILVPTPAPGAACVKGTKPLNIYTSDDDFNFVIKFPETAARNAGVNWVITDYFERQNDSGTAVIWAGRSEITIHVNPLETGHYVVTVWESDNPDEKISDNFAVVTPYKQRPQYTNPEYDSPFATDTSILLNNTWCRNKAFLIEDFARAVQLSGVTWVHQRMIWDTPGNVARADRCLSAFEREGLKVLQDVQYMPADTLKYLPGEGENKAAPGDTLPINLRKAYELAKEYGYTYRDQVSMWEVWNEQETTGSGFTGPGEGADKYAAFLKAMAIGFHDSGMPDPLVTMGGLVTRGELSSAAIRPYQDNMFENGIMEYIDVYNFHNHLGNINPAAETPASKAAYKYFNEEYMFRLDKNTPHMDKRDELNAGMPAWVTEAGGGMADSPTGLDTYAKQKAQAQYLVTSTAMSLSTGVDKHFWFGGVPGYIEQNSPYSDVYWSSFSPGNPATGQITPYAAYVAQSVMTEVLGKAIYLGEVADLPEGAYGYAFQNDGDTVLVLWTTKEQDTAHLNLQKASGVQTNIMGGREVVPSADNVFSLALSKSPIYLTIQGSIPAEAYTASNHTRKIMPAAKTFSEAEKIVLSQTFPVESRSHDVKSIQGYIIERDRLTQVEVMVYNFNNTSITGTVTGSFDIAGYSVSGPTEPFTVAPQSQVKLIYTVTTVGAPAGNAANLSFTGDFNVGQTTPSVAKVYSIPGEPDYTMYYELDLHYADNPGFWNSNDGRYINNPSIDDSNDISKYYLATIRFSKEELPPGSIIEVDAGYGYRPDGWVRNGAAAPGRPSVTTIKRVLVDEDWWGDFQYRGFNMYQCPQNEEDLTGREAEAAAHFRIYVPKYVSLDWRETNGGYWDSVNGGYQADPPHPVMDQTSSPKFIASKRYSREDLPVGTIIEVDPGYQYRPDGWVYQGMAAPGRFPNLISEQRIVLDEERWEEWWGDYEYRGFNVTTAPQPTVSLGDMEAVVPHFRILIPVHYE